MVLCFVPFLLQAQFENRTHLLGGANMKISKDSYELYKNFVVGAETILGFRVGKFFIGAGTGVEYTGTNYKTFTDSLGNIKKIDIYNLDVPIFADFTFGKKFYVEAKLGYTVKVNNIADYKKVNTNTLFNSLGIGYSIPIGKAFIDLAIEGKFNYLFSNSVNTKTQSIYFLPIAKAGFRFTKLK